MAETPGTNENTCALCGQPVELGGFTLTTNKGREKFCCAGCLCIYQLINEPEKTAPTPSPNPEENQP